MSKNVPLEIVTKFFYCSCGGCSSFNACFVNGDYTENCSFKKVQENCVKEEQTRFLIFTEFENVKVDFEKTKNVSYELFGKFLFCDKCSGFRNCYINKFQNPNECTKFNCLITNQVVETQKQRFELLLNF